MALLIKKIHDLIDLAIDNGVSNYWTREQIDNAIDQGQMSLYREILKEWPKTKYVRDELLPFETATNIFVGAGGTASLPSDFEHEIEAYVTVSSVKYPIWIKESGFFRRRVLDPVDPPSSTNVFGMFYYDGGRMIELSATAATMGLRYHKRPTLPVYGTTGASGQYVYDASTSTDLGWSATLHDILIERSLKPLGLGMRDGMVYNAGQSPVPKEASIT